MDCLPSLALSRWSPRKFWTTALILQPAGLGLFARWLKIPRAVSGQAPLCGHFLSFSLPDLPKRVNDQVQGQHGKAGKDLGPIFCNPRQAARQVSPPSLAERAYWHRLPHGNAAPSHTSEQAVRSCGTAPCGTSVPSARSQHQVPAPGGHAEEACGVQGWILTAHHFWQQDDFNFI